MFGNSNPTLNKDVFAPAQTWEDLDRQGRGVPGVNMGRAGSAGTRTGAGSGHDGTLSDADINRAVPASIAASHKVMTLQGTVNKSLFLLALVVTAALGTWVLVAEGRSPGLGYGLTIGGAIVGCILGLVMAFWPKGSPFLAPIFGVAEGAFVGGISSIYAMQFGGKAIADGKVVLNTGLIFNAALLTFAIAGSMLALYAFRVIRPGRVFYNAVFVGSIALIGYTLVAFVLGMFGFPSLRSVFDPNNGGLVSIGFSVLVLILGSAFFVIDFDTVNNGVKNRAEKYYEWYGAYAITSTLVFVYIEALRLMAKLTGRRE
ncbi:MAG: Bax inhibitor-1/YccA family protein [Phycisphaerales bacterium]